MRKKILSIFIVFLLVSFPFVNGAEIVKEEDFDEQDTGASIAINVRSYEPTILTSNLLEDGSVPVYIFLAGSTIGTLLGSSTNIEPVYGGIEIEKMIVKSLNIETNDFLEGDPKWYKPNKFDADNLGYITVTLKQFDPDNFEICTTDSECDDGYTCETGACIPQKMDLNFTAEIWFKNAERLYSLSKSALILPVDSEEDVWVEKLDAYGAMYSFYGGRGLVRVKDITANGVDLTVYSNKDLYWPIIGSPRAIADVHLDKGETSDYIDLGFTDEQILGNAKFRITLNSLKDPAQERAVVSVTVAGVKSQVVVTEGASLFPGSTWIVKDMTITQGRTGVEYTLTLKDAKGNVKKLVTSQAGGLNEGESEVLNKKFSQKRTDDTYFYDASTKKINPSSLENLKNVFQNFDITLDVSDVEQDSAQTKTVTLTDDKTLKQVLIEILPAGYYYGVSDASTVKIKKFFSVDPCVAAEIYTEEGLAETLAEVDAAEKVDNSLKLNLLCTGVSYFGQVVLDADEETLVGTEILVKDEAYKKIAESYEAIARIDFLSTEQKQGAKEKALEAYQKLVDRNSPLKDSNVLGAIESLKNEFNGGLTYGSASLEDNGQFVYAQLISLEQLGQEQLSSAVLTKDGVQKTYFTGDALFPEIVDGKTKYNWYVYSISEDSVQIRKVYSSSSSKSTSKTLEVDKGAQVIEDSSFQVKSTNTKKEAYLTITPGSGKSLRSKSNFSVHIPVESRAFDLNPLKIDDQIAKAKELQEKLDKIVETLRKIVKTWNYVCLGVFAFVSLKSSFLSASAQARHDAIHGVDDESGWNAYCKENSGLEYYNEKKVEYPTYDQCMLANAGAIDKDIDAAQNARDEADAIENIDSSSEIQEISKGYTNLEQCTSLLGDQVFLDDEGKKDYVYLKKLQTDSSLSDLQKASVEEKLKSYTGDSVAYQNAKQEGCNKVAEAVKKEGSGDTEKDKQLAIGVYETTYINYLINNKDTTDKPEIPSVKDLPSLSNDYLDGENSIIVSVGKIFGGKTGNSYTVYDTGSDVGKKIDVSELNYDDYLNIVEKQVGKDNLDYDASGKVTGVKDPCVHSKGQKACDKFEADLRRIYGTDLGGGYTAKERAAAIVASNGEKYYLAGDGTIYVGQAAYSSGSISEKYASSAKIEIYDSSENKGLPYCLPHKNGNFIKFTEYTTNNEIKIMQYWNVGSDGQLCTNDDVLVAHESELNFKTASPSYNDLVTFANKWVKKTWYENEDVEIYGNHFKVSFGKSKAVLDGATASCFDVMDPGDCKLLFNTCDPVMCPPSRFNFGGRWQVDNVVESGIIGSVVLPQGSGDTVSLCLTGILASLNFWKSMLDGYVECLEAAKYEGKSVGICDKVRSVYMCELFVREAAAIMDNNKDGLLDFLANKAYGQKDVGGGEYFQFKENLQNVQNSFSYFTTEYSTTAFAAFKGRSLEEIGSTICQQAIYAQTPWFADFMDQVTTPEDPNQFYATLTVKPYAPSLRRNSYQTYYHIYAGVNPNIQNVVYQVYLKNSLTREIFYTTESCEGVSASLELGGMTDQTLDCLAPEGFDTVCVVMNGETNCGFGTVSTAFGYNYLKDAIVADEAQRNITTEKECYPSVSVASPTASSFASFGSTESLVLPYSYGELSTGIQRVCALQDPGLGQGGQGDWTAVGSCGEDTAGRSLGYCWMNTDSFSIKDAERNANVQEHLKTANYKVLKSGIDNLMDEEISAKAYATFISNYKSATKCADYLSLAQEIKNLYDLTISYTYSVNAQYQLGLIYYLIGNSPNICGLAGRTEIEVDASLDGHDVDSYGEDVAIPAGVIIDRDGNFSVSFSKLQDGEKPVGILEVGGVEMYVPCKEHDGVYTCAIDIASLYTADDDVIDVTFTIEREGAETFTRSYRLSAADDEEKDEAFASASEACDLCGGSFYDLDVCDLEDCNKLSDGCYYDDGIINGDCLACDILDDVEEYPTAKERCAALSDDKKRCEQSSCYGTFLDDEESCYFDEDTSTCAFEGEDTGQTSGGGSSSLQSTSLCGNFEEGFLDKVGIISKNLDVNPLHLLSIMAFESSFNPKAVNSASRATGLIQFIPSTAESLGTTVDELYKMDQIKQLDYVEEYFNGCRGIRNDNYGDVAMCVFYPSAIGKSDSYVIAKKGYEAYDKNSALDTDNDDTISREEYIELSKDRSSVRTLLGLGSLDELKDRCSGEETDEETILYIGDSHSQGAFGKGLYDLLDAQGTVYQYAQCGASPFWWLTEDENAQWDTESLSGWTSTCGTYFNENGELTTRKTVTPLMEDLLLSVEPDVVVVALGANLRDYRFTNPEIVIESVQALASAATTTQTKDVVCYWVGPPAGPDYEDAEDAEAFSALIEDGVGRNCAYIESISLTDSYDFCTDSPYNCDADPHFSSDDAEDVAQSWAQSVYEEIAKDQEW